MHYARQLNHFLQKGTWGRAGILSRTGILYEYVSSFTLGNVHLALAFLLHYGYIHAL
jgi:hypothetical protein